VTDGRTDQRTDRQTDRQTPYEGKDHAMQSVARVKIEIFYGVAPHTVRVAVSAEKF